MKINVSWFKRAAENALAFGKKNASTIMTGGSVVLGWTAVYIFWKESKKADIAIERENERREENDEVPLSKKEKFVYYLQYCWLAALLGLLSTGFNIGARKIDADDYAKLYLVTKFLEDKNSDQKNLIEKLKNEVSDRKFEELSDEIIEEKHPEASIKDGDVEDTGKGSTLFIPDISVIPKFRSSITDVQEAIMQYRDTMAEERRKALKKELTDAFYVNDKVYPTEDDDHELYVSGSLEDFADRLGIRTHINMGELLEFRDYGYKDFMSFGQVMRYKDFVDPVTGVPAICFLSIERLLYPSSKLINREP